jgi:uncharacterized protein (TIGR00661 family)
MKRIFYGLSGEGLGHASRTLAVIDYLTDAEIHVFTYGKAYQFFKNMGYPHLHEIHGMMFSYHKGKVDYLATALRAWNYYWYELPENMEKIRSLDAKLDPALYVGDFEPSVPRAAKKTHKPLISVDNQHRFAYVDMLKLPLRLRIYGWGCGFMAKMMVPNPQHTIISTFHWDKIKVRRTGVTLTNGLLRRSVADAEVSDEGYILIYLRDSVSDRVLNAIQSLCEKFVIFGASETALKQHLEKRSNFVFKSLSPDFTTYLAKCSCVISTAGNQLLTEARYFGKPVLTIPEPGQYEQDINAHYASYINMGRMCSANTLDAEKVMQFLNLGRRCCYVRYEPHLKINGVHEVIKIMREYL